MNNNIDSYKIKIKNLIEIKIMMIFVLIIFLLILLGSRYKDSLSFMEYYLSTEKIETVSDIIRLYFSSYVLIITVPLIILLELVSIIVITVLVFIRAKKYYNYCINELTNEIEKKYDYSKNELIKKYMDSIKKFSRNNQIINELGFLIWIILYFLHVFWIISMVIMVFLLFINIYYSTKTNHIYFKINNIEKEENEKR